VSCLYTHPVHQTCVFIEILSILTWYIAVQIMFMLQHTFYMQNEQAAEPAQNVHLGDNMSGTLFHSALEVRRTLLTELEGSALLMPKPTIGHSLEPFQSILHSQNLFH